MKKRNLTHWMLLISALLLAAFILFIERGSKPSREQQQRLRTVFAVFPETIDRIEMERDGVQIECIKKSTGWRMIRPADTAVDAGIVEKMISGMARVERGEIITPETLRARGLTPTDYGFDAPRAKITFQNNRGTFTWLIGRNAPVGDSLYVMSAGGGDIISAPKALLNLVPQDPSWIRERILFPGEPSAVRGLDLRRPAGFLQLRIQDPTGWIMQQPHAGRADRPAIHTLLEKLLAGRIASFVIDEKTDLTPYGLDKPACELTLFMQDGRTQTLLVGNALADKPEQRYAKRSETDPVFTVSADWAAHLDTDDDPLRSRRLIGFSTDRLTAIQINRGEQQVELVRGTNLWQVTRPARWDADPARMTELLQALDQAVITEFIDNSAGQNALSNAAPWILLLSADGRTNTLRVSDADAGNLRTALYNDEPSLYRTPASLLQDHFADPLYYRPRTVLEINPVSIQSVTSQAAGEKEQTIRKTEQTRYATDSTGHKVDMEALNELMWALHELKAVRYISFNPESMAGYGLETPQHSLTIQLDSTNAPGRIILLGAPAQDGRFAMIQGQDILFTVSEETAKALTRSLTVPVEKPTEQSQTP